MNQKDKKLLKNINSVQLQKKERSYLHIVEVIMMKV